MVARLLDELINCFIIFVQLVHHLRDARVLVSIDHLLIRVLLDLQKALGVESPDVLNAQSIVDHHFVGYLCSQRVIRDPRIVSDDVENQSVNVSIFSLFYQNYFSL
jgi:hypothetical protein